MSGVASTTLHLVRHAEQAQDAADDPGLLALGREQARWLGDRFPGVPLEAVLHSSQRRAAETAQRCAVR